MHGSADINTDGVHKIGKGNFDMAQGRVENNVQSIHKFICINYIVHVG